MNPYRIEPLGPQHDRPSFHSGSAALDRYLHQQARQDADKRVAAPFVLSLPPSSAVLGYYTLAASLLSVDEIPAEQRKRLPRYPQLPVTLLGRLAVSEGLKGQGIGQFLLMDALHRSLIHAAEIAAFAVLVEAKDAAAAAFYRHFDFTPLQPHSATPVERLFLPMKTVANLFIGS